MPTAIASELIREALDRGLSPARAVGSAIERLDFAVRCKLDTDTYLACRFLLSQRHSCHTSHP